MGRKRSPGLVKRKETWHIDKDVQGYGRLCESTGTGEIEEAERYLARRQEEVRQAIVYGVRPTRKFSDAAAKFLKQRMNKRSVERDAQDLKLVVSYIGDLDLRSVHDGTLEKFVSDRLAKKRSAGTINRTLRVVHNVLVHATKWRDEFNLTWLEVAPLITQLDNSKARQPYPLGWEEQELLFSELAEHLKAMALYGVNTGSREQEIVQLRWQWEWEAPELKASVFVIPGDYTKNGMEKVVVLNRVARAVVEAQRGKHPEFVFTEAVEIRKELRGRVVRIEHRPVTRFYNSGWRRARRDAAKRYMGEFKRECPQNFKRIRVQDLRHTFGRRLRAAGVSFEDRQDLMGHKSTRVTTHYSAAEIGNLIDAVEKIAAPSSRKSPALTLVRSAAASAIAANSLK